MRGVVGANLSGMSSMSVAQMGMMIGSPHAPLVGGSSFTMAPAAMAVAGIENALTRSPGRTAFYANGAGSSKTSEGAPATFDDFKNSHSDREVYERLQSMIGAEDWEGVLSAIRYGREHFYYFIGNLIAAFDFHVKEHGDGVLPDHIREECATLRDDLTPFDFTALGVQLRTANIFDVLKLFRSLMDSKDWERVSTVLEYARERWNCRFKNHLILVVSGHIKQHGEDSVPAHIREKCALLCDGLGPDDLKTDIFTTIIREQVRDAVQKMVDTIQKRKGPVYPEPRPPYGIPRLISDGMTQSETYFEIDDIGYRIYHGVKTDFKRHLSWDLDHHKEDGSISGHVLDAVKEPTGKDFFASDFIKFLNRVGMLEEAWPLLACVNQFCNSEEERNEKVLFIDTLIEYIEEHGEVGVPNDVIIAWGRLPHRLRIDRFRDFLAGGEWEEVRPFLSPSEEHYNPPKKFIEVLNAHFVGLLRQGEWQEVEFLLKEAREHYSYGVETVLAESLAEYKETRRFERIEMFLSKGEWAEARPYLSPAGEHYDPNIASEKFMEMLITRFNDHLHKGHWQEAGRALTEAHEHYSPEIKTLLADDLVGHVDAHGVRDMTISVLDAGAALLSPLCLQIFEDHLNSCGVKEDDSEAWEVTAVLAHPDAAKEFAEALSRFLQVNNKRVPRHVLLAGSALLGDEESELARRYASEVSRYHQQLSRDGYGYYDRYYYGEKGYKSEDEIREQAEQKIKSIVGWGERMKEVPFPIRLHKAANKMTARAKELKELHEDIAEKRRGPLSPLVDRYNESRDASFLSYETVALALQGGEHTDQDVEMCQIMLKENELGSWRWRVVEELLNRDRTSMVAQAVFDHSRSEDVGGAYRRRDSVPPEIIELAQAVMERPPSNVEQPEDVPESNGEGLGRKLLAFVGRFNPWS